MIITWETTVSAPSAQAPAALESGDWDVTGSRIEVTQDGDSITVDSEGAFTINAKPIGVIIEEGEVFNDSPDSTAETITLEYAGGTEVSFTDLRDDSTGSVTIPTLTAGTIDQGPNLTEGPNYDALTISGSNVTFRGTTTPQFSSDDVSFSDFEGDESTTQIPTGFVRIRVAEGLQEVFTPSIQITEDLGVSANLFLPGDDGFLYETLGNFYTDTARTTLAGDGDTVQAVDNRAPNATGVIDRGNAAGDLPILRIPGGGVKPYLELGPQGSVDDGLEANFLPAAEGTLIMHYKSLDGARAPYILNASGGNQHSVRPLSSLMRGEIGEKQINDNGEPEASAVNDQVAATIALVGDGAGNYRFYNRRNDETLSLERDGTYSGTAATGAVFRIRDLGALYALLYVDRSVSKPDLENVHEYWKANLSEDGA